jgi:hypothetical protein
MDKEMTDLVKFIISQLPGGLSSFVILAGLILYAIKAEWIPLYWRKKEDKPEESKHYITREQLLDNCEGRQGDLDTKLDKKFSEVFRMLRDINKNMELSLKEFATQIAKHDKEIAVLQERSSHHRKDDPQ